VAAKRFDASRAPAASFQRANRPDSRRLVDHSYLRLQYRRTRGMVSGRQPPGLLQRLVNLGVAPRLPLSWPTPDRLNGWTVAGPRATPGWEDDAAILAAASSRLGRGTTGANSAQGWDPQSGQNVSFGRTPQVPRFGENDLSRNSRAPARRNATPRCLSLNSRCARRATNERKSKTLWQQTDGEKLTNCRSGFRRETPALHPQQPGTPRQGMGCPCSGAARS